MQSGEEMVVLNRNVVHMDMDCYFVSVATRWDPALQSRPCVVCHAAGSSAASTSKSSAEIASANYVARGFGVSAGMTLGRARALCPDVVVLPYLFEDIVACSKVSTLRPHFTLH